MSRFSFDILAIFFVSLAFTLLGVVTGAQFFVILCGACLLLATIEIVVTLRRSAPRPE